MSSQSQLSSDSDPFRALLGAHSTGRRFLILATLCIVLHLPTMLTLPMCTDEGVYAFVGHQWLHWGEALYVDTGDNKPPGVYLIDGTLAYLWGTNIIPARIAALVAHIATAVLLAQLGAWLATPGAGLAAGVLYAVASAGHSFEGHYALTEVFGLPLVAGSMCLAWLHATRGGAAPLLGAGVAAGLALWFKQPFLLEFLAVTVFVWVHSTRAPWRGVPAVLCLLAGWLVPLCALACYLAASGLLQPAYEATIKVLPSIGVRPLSRIVLSRMIFEPFMESSLLVFLASMGCLGVWWGDGTKRALLLLWLLASVLSAASSGTPWPHCLLPMLPPVSLLAALGLASLLRPTVAGRESPGDRRAGAIFAGIGVVVVCSLVGIGLSGVSNSSVVRGLAGAETMVDTHRRIGDYIRSHSAPHDRIYVEGHDMPIYVYADRGSPFAYLSATVQKRDREQCARELDQKRPLFYVCRGEVPHQLRNLVDLHYRPVEGYPGVYERISAAPR